MAHCQLRKASKHLGGPEVRRLAHWGGRGDGVDGHHLGQLVRDVGGGVAPVAHLHAPRGGGGIRGGGEGGGAEASRPTSG